MSPCVDSLQYIGVYTWSCVCDWGRANTWLAPLPYPLTVSWEYKMSCPVSPPISTPIPYDRHDTAVQSNRAQTPIGLCLVGNVTCATLYCLNVARVLVNYSAIHEKVYVYITKTLEQARTAITNVSARTRQTPQRLAVRNRHFTYTVTYTIMRCIQHCRTW